MAACAALPAERGPAAGRARAGTGGGAARARPAGRKGAGSRKRAGGGRRLPALHLSAPLGRIGCQGRPCRKESGRVLEEEGKASGSTPPPSCV